VRDGTSPSAEAPAAPPQQVTSARPTDTNTVDVEAKSKS
jgi:hypothetical protein